MKKAVSKATAELQSSKQRMLKAAVTHMGSKSSKPAQLPAAKLKKPTKPVKGKP